MLNLIADQAWNPFAPFGVTSWEPFVANLIAFILMVVILRYLAFKPIQNVLEKLSMKSVWTLVEWIYLNK